GLRSRVPNVRVERVSRELGYQLTAPQLQRGLADGRTAIRTSSAIRLTAPTRFNLDQQAGAANVITQPQLQPPCPPFLFRSPYGSAAACAGPTPAYLPGSFQAARQQHNGC